MLNQPQRGQWVWGSKAARPDRGRRTCCCLGGAETLSGSACRTENRPNRHLLERDLNVRLLDMEDTSTLLVAHISQLLLTFFQQCWKPPLCLDTQMDL